MSVTEKIDNLLGEASPMLMMKTEILRLIKNKQRKDMSSILDRYWAELSSSKEGKKKWDKLNPKEKKSLTKFFNDLHDSIDSGKEI